VFYQQYIYVFCVDLRTNSDYFSLHYLLIGFYNRGRECSLCGTDWVFKSDGYSFILKGPITKTRNFIQKWVWNNYFSHGLNRTWNNFVQKFCLNPYFKTYVQNISKQKCMLQTGRFGSIQVISTWTQQTIVLQCRPCAFWLKLVMEEAKHHLTSHTFGELAVSLIGCILS